MFFKIMKKEPVSRKFGYDRGLPIDRYYIEKFLDANRGRIRGDVLEVGCSEYTKMFGTDGVRPFVLGYAGAEGADISCNLETGEGVPESMADCFIVTQTLPFIYDVRSALTNCLRVLRPGGALLFTVPGITQISRHDYERWGHYWSFTDMSVRRLTAEAAPSANAEVCTYGNVKSAACFLYGMAAHELNRAELDRTDPDYQMVIAAVVEKP